MLTLRRLVDEHTFGRIPLKEELRSVDIRLYLYISYHPLASITELAQSLGVAPSTIRESVRRLIKHGWAYRWKLEGKRGQLIVPWMPLDVELAVISAMAQLRTEVSNYGEWLMKAVLDLLVHDRDCRDNARLQWLTSASTGRRLELDRWYRRAAIAFEFQGPQHSQIGDRYVRTEEQLQKRMDDDQTKRDRCDEYRVHLIEITGYDLSFEYIQNAIGNKLPLTPIREHSPLIRELTGMLQEYVDNYVRRFGPRTD